MTPTPTSGFEPFIGNHCETVATGTLLKAAGIELSEPMLFGLGEGLAFIIINLSSMPLPFVGGRTKPFELTRALCRNLGVDCEASETTSKQKAWTAIESPMARGKPVGLQLDSFYLDYFSRPVHFAGHFVAVCGLDHRGATVVDTVQQGSLQRISRVSLEKARFAKGPMAAKARSWTIERPGRAPALHSAVRQAIHSNASSYLKPGFKGASFLGIRKLADSLPHWQAQASRPQADLEFAAMLMERAGTGGGLFRNFYRDFLLQAVELLGRSRALVDAQRLFAESATEWTTIAALIQRSSQSGESAPLVDAAARCRRVADLEVAAMKQLAAM